MYKNVLFGVSLVPFLVDKKYRMNYDLDYINYLFNEIVWSP